MTHPRFFGFGSLVNCATHSYPNTRAATLRGWRREWICTEGRGIAYLSARPIPGAEIEGLTADVPNGDWAALDARETGYGRQVLEAQAIDDTEETWVYAVPENDRVSRQDHVILQSYLDVVLQGFQRQSGEAGLRQFFATTDGWDVPVFDDRAKPRYPRHQVIPKADLELFDQLRRDLT